MQPSFVTFENVCKYYQNGGVRIAAADHVSFTIEQGEFCIIVGPSGAGKTTVLNMLGGMDMCDEGKILLDGNEISAYNDRQLTQYRRYDVGFVFQFYNLVQNLRPKFAATRWMLLPFCVRWAWSIVWTISPHSFPAANSSAFPLRAHWPKTPKFCCAMNRPAHWTM